MTHLPITRELQPLEKRATLRKHAAREAWYRFTGAVTNPDVIIVVAFCAIGLLLTINLVLRFPDFGALASELEWF